MILRHLISIDNYISESALNEVGEANIPNLKWELDYSNDRDALYTFNHGPETYKVHINKRSLSDISFYFSCDDDRDNSTNSGSPLTVMGTVISILKDYLSNNPDVNTFSFVPTVEYPDDDRRFNIYMAYIKKNFRRSKISVDHLPRGYKSVDVRFK